MKKIYDVVILGGGPAGLSAGIYSARGRVSTAIIDVSLFGGQPSNYLELENYPGFGKIGGYDLMEKMENHVDSFGVDKFTTQEIISIDLVSNPKIIKTIEHDFSAKSVIIATGSKPAKLGVKGEDKFLGLGVSYCAICDGAFYKDKVVSVVGGGNSAVEEAQYLTRFASKVYLIHRRNELRADKSLQDRLFSNSKIEVLYDTEVLEILGGAKVEELKVINNKTGNVENISIDGVFPYIGNHPNAEMFSGQLLQNSQGFIITNEMMQTSIDGVFAVGDVRNTPLRQVITAVSDGAIGAVYALRYIESILIKNKA